MKNKFLLFASLILLLIVSTSRANSNKIDSLRNELRKSNNDTISINILNKLLFESRKINPEKALNYSDMAFKLAAKTGFKKGQATTYLMLGSMYYDNGNFNDALRNYKKSLVLRQELNDSSGIAQSLNNMGDAFVNLGYYKDAIKNYFDAIDIGIAMNDVKLIGYNNVAAAYYYLGDYTNAIQNYIKAAEVFEKNGKTEKTVNPLLGIGNVYMVMKNYKKALPYYHKALEISSEFKNSSGVFNSLNNIGIVYENVKKNDSALTYYQKALEIAQNVNNKSFIANSFLNIGNVQIRLKRNYFALEYYRKALKIYELTENKNGVSESLINMGVLLCSKGDLDSSIVYFNKSLGIAQMIGRKELVMKIKEGLSEAYFKKKDFKESYNNFRNYCVIKDSLLNESHTKSILETNTKYESEKKEKEIELLLKDKELQNAEIGKQKLIRNATIIALFTALLFAILLFNRFRVTSKQKKIIEYQNSQIGESINYSKKIQEALLPSLEQMQQSLPGLFVYYSPKDIIGGDFYYFKEYEKYVLLTCVDCTGRGVSGGFMSTIGGLLLDKIVDSGIVSPAEIMYRLRDEIIKVLRHDGDGGIQDGMDLSVCLLHKESKILEFSCARNGIVVVSNNESKSYNANALPAVRGIIKKDTSIIRNFQTKKIQLQATDRVYMYTDGFMKQSGGSYAQPMTSTEFENKLIALSHKSFENKTHYLQSELDGWRGNSQRVDDVLIIEIKL